MTTLIHRRVAACRADALPQAVARVRSGWVVLGDVQVRPGYCLILPDPVPPHLNALSAPDRAALLADVTELGDVLLEITGAVRINYEIIGNLEPALHVHLFPRHDDEPDGLRTQPIWSWDWETAPRFDAARDAELMARIRAGLAARHRLHA